MEDQQIPDLFFARDEAAIAQTDRKYGPALKRLSENITGDRLDAEECVSDTYMKAWDCIPPQRPAHFFSWLAAVTRNLSINRYHANRTAKRSALIVELSKELEECIGSGEIQPEEIVLRDALDGFLRVLDREARYVFIRRYFYAETLAAISAATRRSENNLASLLLRTRKKLKKYLEKEGVAL